MCEYELNPFTNDEVMANVRVFEKLDLQGQGHPGVKVKNLYVNLKVLSQRVLCVSMK